MKLIYRTFCLTAVLIITLNACSEDFLERTPLDEVSAADYWTTTNDLKLFVNTFYPSAFAVSGSDRYENIFEADRDGDDFVFAIAYPRLAGTTVIPGAGGWDYSNIRSLNLMLDNLETIEGSEDEYNQFVGEAHYFRAHYYFDLVKTYGAVPLIEKPLNTDSEELYEARTPRNEVIDFILTDLDKAIELLPSEIQEGKTRLNKDVALLFKSRVALYEGTWEKYHNGDPFGVSGSNPTKYLEQAVSASETLINSGNYNIHSTNNPEWDYFMFGEVDYSNNDEVLFWKKYDLNLGIGHARMFQTARGTSGGAGLTKSLVESYLCTDGKPIFLAGGVQNPLYQGDNTLMSTTANRDPRLVQTVFTPGFPIQISGVDTTKFVRPVVDQPSHTKNTTGYQINKTLNFDGIHHASQTTSGVGFSGWIIMRYAEVLLNYAEAKAELGTLSQADIDKSIKLLRDRVGMPNLNLSNIEADPNWLFPDLSPEINEIRRERRVELVAEGFRWDDIARWAAADELVVGKRYLGAKFNSTDYPDLKAEDFRLTDGYFDELKNQLPNGNGFKLDRDYLSPISTEELTLNPNLVQNPGW